MNDKTKKLMISLLLLLIIAAAIFAFTNVDSIDENDVVDTKQQISEKQAPVNKNQPDNSTFIRLTVEQVKSRLPINIDENTVFTDIVGGKNDMTYFYTIDMDLSKLSSEQQRALKENLSPMVCPQSLPTMCTMGKMFFDMGIDIYAKYKDQSGILIAQCAYTPSDCAAQNR